MWAVGKWGVAHPKAGGCHACGQLVRQWDLNSGTPRRPGTCEALGRPCGVHRAQCCQPRWREKAACGDTVVTRGQRTGALLGTLPHTGAPHVRGAGGRSPVFGATRAPTSLPTRLRPSVSGPWVQCPGGPRRPGPRERVCPRLRLCVAGVTAVSVPPSETCRWTRTAARLVLPPSAPTPLLAGRCPRLA